MDPRRVDGGAAAVGRLVSGGQTGVDRAALEVAVELGLPYGGWCPAGGAAEDLPRPPGVRALFPDLEETDSPDPAVRTERNVRDSDATLVLVPGRDWHSPGTDLTLECCRRHRRPHLVTSLDNPGAAAAVAAWLQQLPQGARLDVAGPRESQAPGVRDAARAVLLKVLGPTPGA